MWHLVVLAVLGVPLLASAVLFAVLVGRRGGRGPVRSVDPATGRAYEVDPVTGQSRWVDGPPPDR